MVEGRDIAGVSVMYLAGVAATAAASPAKSVLYAAGPAGLAAAIIFLILFCRKSGARIWILATFFSLGIFSFCCTEMCSHTTWPQPAAARNAFQLLKATIHDIGLKSEYEALVTALLTGDRSGLAGDTVSAFRNAGAAHILALSGLHLGIVYGLFKRFLALAGNSRGAEVATSLTSVLAAGFYVLLTGCSASVVRAFLFICLNETARLCPDRMRNPMAIYSTALTIQLTITPSVISSAGFQLSYLAMLGIYTLFPRLDAWYPGSKKRLLKRIWSSAALTLSCQIFTAPLVWLYFKSFPVYFLITNLVALPLTEALIVCAVASTITTAAGLCPPPLIHITDFFAETLIDFLEAVASIS